MLELLSFGDQGWGDEMLLAGLMTILVSLSSVCLGLLIGVILASFKLSKSRIEGYRNFATKLWNASRYTELNDCKYNPDFDPNNCKLAINNWIIFELRNAVIKVETSIQNYRFNDAANAIYNFSWATFCDWYIEFLKPIFDSKNESHLNESRNLSAYILANILIILHPFIPFFTEKVWQDFSFDKDFKTIASKLQKIIE